MYKTVCKMSFDELREFMCACYYACDHYGAELAIEEMERRFPEEFDAMDDD